MATTTNYGWTTPDDTALVKDGAAAIRTLGSSIDTTTKNLNPQTTTGAIAYRSATSNINTSLPIGTAGQVLRVNSGATAPEWGTPATAALVLIKRSAFSAVADTGTTFDDVFTSTYKAYRVIIEDIASSSAPPITLRWQWRKPTATTHTTAYYAGSTRVNFNGAETLAGNNNASSYSLDAIGNTAANAYSFDVYRVGTGSTVYPLIYGMGTGYSGNIGPFTFGGTLDSTINATGFILSGASGNITGTVAIYGLATA